jgi:cytochrome c oxidase cbb3-type subunit 1
MSKTTLGFILVSLFYLLLGVTLGVVFFIIPEARALRSVHAHLNLMGFVIFMIFGVAYHILPRFRGRPLHSEGLAWAQFWLANVGLVGLLILMGLNVYITVSTALLALFGALLALSVYLFVYNLGRTLI